MKTRLLLFALLFTGTLFSQEAKHVIFITIDGFRPDFYLEPNWNTPNLHALMNDGAYAKGVNSVFPSMTYPSHTTIITGVQPAKHGVYYNSMFEPRGSTGKIYWNDSSIHATTIFAAAKKKGMTTAALFWPVSADAPVDYNIPDIGSLGEPAREKYSKPEGFISLMKKEVFNTTEKIDYGKNQNVAKIAAYVIKKSKPELMTIHVFSVDHAAHLQGRTGPMVEEAISDADEAVGIIVDALKSAGIWETTVLMIGGDHGFYNVSRSVNPNTWLKNAGLINNAKADDWKAMFNSVGGSSYLYLKDPSDKATLAQVEKILADQPDSVKRLFRIINREQLNKVGANPEVAFALSAENDASFGNLATGESVKPGKGGTHGHFPDTKNIRTGLILHGPGIRKGTVVEEMNLRDMAPIISKLLGLSMPPMEGSIPKNLLTK
jgi:predicted AlkP superfamily pyrophosphatase or phosphodiesterase